MSQKEKFAKWTIVFLVFLALVYAFFWDSVINAVFQRAEELQPRRSYAEFVEDLVDHAVIAAPEAGSGKLISSSDPQVENNDFNNFQGEAEDGWFVLADLEGPGFISRFWTTGGDNNHKRLRFYFDGEKEPRIDATISEMRAMDTLYIEPLAAWEQSCWYSLVPISYRERVKVLMSWDGSGRRFYQINYSDLPAGAAVESFPSKLSDADFAAVGKLADAYRHGVSGSSDMSERLENTLVVPPGGEKELLRVDGSATLKRVDISFVAPSASTVPKQEDLLRRLRLRVEWDESGRDSIDVPLTAFGGGIWECPDYDSIYFGKSNQTYSCRFPMPFRESASFRIWNDADMPVTLSISALIEGDAVSTDGYLHAVWSRSSPRQVGRPHVLLSAHGSGRYLGCVLGASSMDRSWWLLESNEYIVTDGERRASWRGTGLEDYFNGGWYYKNNLVRPLHGLVHKVPFQTVQYRLHRNSTPRFEDSIRVFFERGPGNDSRGLMEGVAFYYLDQPSAAESAPLSQQLVRQEDPFEQAVVMQTLCNYERLGDYQGASRYIDLFLERYPSVDFGEILRLRQIAYQEWIEGPSATLPLYEQFARSTKDPRAKELARLLIWYHRDPTHALVSLNSKMPASVYLDGNKLGSVEKAEHFRVFPVKIERGRHAIAVETVRGEHPNWMHWTQACLRTHAGLIGTGSDWKCAWNPSGDWREAGYDDQTWPRVGDALRSGPPMLPHALILPHPFVDMHSRAWGVWNSEGKPEKGDRIVFRKGFELGKH